MSGPATRTGLRAAASRRREVGDAVGSGAGAAVDPARDRLGGAVRVGLVGPVVHRDRDEGRALRRQRRGVDRATDRRRDVGGPRRLVATT